MLEVLAETGRRRAGSLQLGILQEDISTSGINNQHIDTISEMVLSTSLFHEMCHITIPNSKPLIVAIAE
jgi:hypothetical protein